MPDKTDSNSGIRVLIVEDEALVAEEIQGRLRNIGHIVVGIVDTGPKAIEMAARTRPDLILMDIRLKGSMDGIDAAAWIYAQLHLPVVYVTAHADEATLRRAKATGPFGYVVKPFQERELVMAVDIAVQRHRMEKSLQEGHLTYAAILESVADAVIATDKQSLVRFLNPVAAALTGWRSEEARGRPVGQVMRLVDPATGGEASDPLGQVLREDPVESPEKPCRLMNRDGRWATVEVRKTPVRDISGKLIGAVAVLRDLTEQRRAEERFRNLLESAPDAIVIANEGGEILLVNSRTEELFGYPRAEMVGKLVEMLVPERLREPHPSHRGRYAAFPRTRPMGAGAELYGRRKDGTEFPVEMSLAPLETEEGLVVSTSIRDLTERKRAEEELRQARKMEAIGTLAGGIAHDFNNILTSIMGYLDIARWDIDHPERVEASLDEIAKSADRAKNLVRQILSFSRQERLRRVPLTLGPIVEELMSFMRATLPPSVALHSFIDPNTPGVLADGNQIHQVLLNLCTNAWHALPETGGRIVVNLAAVEVAPEAAGLVAGLGRGRFARLSVQDNGHGIDEATRARVFDPFFTTKEPGKGSGLGLSVALGVVQSHQGVIDLCSEPGVGTAIHLYFPAMSPEKLA
jgi:PAS domain S-box-containing protein